MKITSDIILQNGNRMVSYEYNEKTIVKITGKTMRKAVSKVDPRKLQRGDTLYAKFTQWGVLINGHLHEFNSLKSCKEFINLLK